MVLFIIIVFFVIIILSIIIIFALNGISLSMLSVLIISVGLAAVWELAGKRAFAREVLENARIASNIEKAGLTSIGASYIDEPEWENLFNGVRELDVFVAYGQTWRNNQLARLRAA